jgi:hypothetical protein
VFERNTHNGINSPSGAPNSRLGFYWSGQAHSGVTIRDSEMRGGDSDGLHTGTAVDVINNRFVDICADGPNHTDMLQFEGAVGGRIAGNLFSAPNCTTQALTSYDGGTVGVVIEDNVIDVNRPWGIEFYADRDSVIRHNTLRWYPDSACEYTGIVCGQIDITHKSEDPRSDGTQVYDNIATFVNMGDTINGSAHHNVSGQNAVYVGPLDTWAGFELSSLSPVGKGTASDGLDNGIRIAP